MNKRVTIKDVATEAGVSKSTVSLVIQDSTLVKKPTAEKVRAAIKKLGYVYNRAAASLRNSSSGLVGLVVNDLTNPFFTEFSVATQMALAQNGLVTVIANTDENPEEQQRVIQSMLEHGVSAMVVCPVLQSSETCFDSLLDAGIPTLQVLRFVAGTDQRVPYVRFDYAAGGRLAMDHLGQLGVRRVAYVGGLEEAEITQERLQGYQAKAQEMGIDLLTFFGRPHREFGKHIADRLVAEYPDVEAVVCFNDIVALGCASQLRRHDKIVGRDIRLVGFDDIENCSFTYPSITSIHCDIGELGRHVAGMIQTALEGKALSSHGSTLPVHLVERESTLGM